MTVKTGRELARRETKWIHRGTGALVEVHTDLVHERRMRAAFSLTYQDLEGQHQSPAALLAVAVTHGATHFYAWLRHVVDICQAARALPAEEEARFEALTLCTGTRFAAIVGLTLAYRLMSRAALSRYRQRPPANPPRPYCRNSKPRGRSDCDLE